MLDVPSSYVAILSIQDVNVERGVVAFIGPENVSSCFPLAHIEKLSEMIIDVKAALLVP
jgi:hypothetical protein